MCTKYAFDNKAFRKKFLPKLVLFWGVIPAILNLLAALNHTWSFMLFVIVGTFTGILVWGIYFNQKLQWKLAYVMLYDSYILYFRVVKDGYASDVSTYEYKARETIVFAPFKYRIVGNKLCLEGNVVERIYKDQKHQQMVTKRRSAVKILMYFEKQEEMLNELHRYN